ncbi:hypothetical protein JWG45_07005 [Leptospira sp. 201903070]|uniref:Uncharacterized protein n=1 Tax=Leptospira ainlahdjerensis TaxID=2810033 RepID=A0ABS2U955_9LEPT|nr:hypothetical protein [Leptospira ainlahdjerensis]MBM9576901.1 hypothetical protein [Leptospira ainlahdjerensis]
MRFFENKPVFFWISFFLGIGIAAPNISAENRKVSANAFLKLKNVKFRLEDEIYFTVNKLTVEAISNRQGSPVNFNDPSSFHLNLFQGETEFEISVLEFLFNENIKTFPNFPLRKLKLSSVEIEGKRKIRITGEYKLVFWVDVEMICNLELVPNSSTLILKSESMSAAGIPGAGDFLSYVGVGLKTLLPIPEGRGLKIIEKSFRIQSFLLLPPPRIEGTIVHLELFPDRILVRFDSQKIPSLPRLSFLPGIPNQIAMSGGEIRVGSVFLKNTDLHLIDQDPSDPLDFHIKNLLLQLSSGNLNLNTKGELKVFLPDYEDLKK